VGDNQEAKQEIKVLFEDSDAPFNTPKPVRLIKRILQLSTDKDSLVLDSFAGSGTTGHAVLDLNKEDGGDRKFIMVEMEDVVAKDITAERVKRAIKKYGYKDGFEYCELSRPLFDENGQIEGECEYKQLATYIYFTETQTNIDLKNISGNFIGEFGEIEYYLFFKEKGKNVLDKLFLKELKKGGKRKVVYADNCLISDSVLEQYNLIFKQIQGC
jgi:adenine-specific DNA-methyltransferase